VSIVVDLQVRCWPMTIPDQIGQYRIDRRIGGGGMAEVYRARRIGAERFSRVVAIKRVLPEHTDSRTYEEMLIREAQLSATLHHPNIVSVFDFDRDPEHGLFLVMELIEGRDLHQLLATGALPRALTIHVIIEVLRGLGYAHQAWNDETGQHGIVHRDVSPHNVLLSWDGTVKVSDFGIAKGRRAFDASASMVIRGKPGYLSPEQINGRPLDGRSDLFAVGVMMWEMLVGESPFRASTLGEILAATLCPVPAPREVRPEIPADLSAVVARLLEVDRDRRPHTATDAIAALQSCGDAPRAGRDALADTMLARFPGDAVRPSSALTVRAAPRATPRGAAPTAPPGELPLGHHDALSLSASQGRRGSRTMLGAIFLGVALAGAAAVGGAAAQLRSRKTSEARPVLDGRDSRGASESQDADAGSNSRLEHAAIVPAPSANATEGAPQGTPDAISAAPPHRAALPAAPRHRRAPALDESKMIQLQLHADDAH
jgi:eukaryotic-like serine/threonine-protein kinase